MRSLKKMLIFTLLLTMGSLSCTGPIGPNGEAGTIGQTGATGPKGDTGAVGQTGATGSKGDSGSNGLPGIQGIQGIQGIPGVAGQNGNANVKTYTYVVGTSSWIKVDPRLYANLSATFITEDINNNGAILVYYSNGNGGWGPLPWIEFKGSSYFSRFSFAHSVGSLTIWKEDSDAIQAIAPSSTMTFKIVVIQGLVGQSYNLPSILDAKNYNEIKAFYKIVD